MVNSSQIPSGYVLQWDAGARQKHASASSSGMESSGVTNPKYCHSCDNCRRSRVKCSGGQPCSRCTKSSSNASSCVYSISQRQGGRKARRPSSRDSSSFSASSTSKSIFALSDALPAADNLMAPPMEITMEDIQYNMIHPSAANFLQTPTSGPPLSPLHFSLVTDNTTNDFGTATHCNCYILNQSFVNRIDAIVKEPATFGLDTVLCSLQEVAVHIASYLHCPHCDTSCSRLMNLAMLHQRQVALMCAIAKNPSIFLGGPASDSLRFTLGVYQLPEQNNATFKRLAILSAARNVDFLVASFDVSIRTHQDLASTGSVVSETESAKLNLKWLLDVSMNLKTRLEVIICILEKSEWAAY